MYSVFATIKNITTVKPLCSPPSVYIIVDEVIKVSHIENGKENLL